MPSESFSFFLALLLSFNICVLSQLPSNHVRDRLSIPVRNVSASRGICYPELGCFNTDFPFSNTGQAPQDPDFINTVFKLFTRRSPTVPQILRSDNCSTVLESNFNRNQPVKFVIHGFMATSTLLWVKKITWSLLRKHPMNVIVIDWGQGAGFPYVQAAANTRMVGAQGANLITCLNNVTGTSSRQCHLIGHSLGAHVAGYIGHRIHGIGRITGLDPAQLYFQGQPPIVRLDPTDANFVDAIHTDDSAFDNLGGYGMSQAVGHVDFFPNGGAQQPGCQHFSWLTFLSSFYNSGADESFTAMGCNHQRSISLFTESISTRCPFFAYPCSSFNDFLNGKCVDCNSQPCPPMGYAAEWTKARGNFFLKTNARKPFCGYHYAFELELGPNMNTLRGQLNIRIHGSQGQTEVFEVQSGTVRPNSVVRHVVHSSRDVDEVRGADVTFTRAYEFWDYIYFWNTDRGFQILQLNVTSFSQNQRVTFCFDPEFLTGNDPFYTIPC